MSIIPGFFHNPSKKIINVKQELTEQQLSSSAIVAGNRIAMVFNLITAITSTKSTISYVAKSDSVIVQLLQEKFYYHVVKREALQLLPWCKRVFNRAYAKMLELLNGWFPEFSLDGFRS